MLDVVDFEADSKSLYINEIAKEKSCRGAKWCFSLGKEKLQCY